jgi:hypothetical protein
MTVHGPGRCLRGRLRGARRRRARSCSGEELVERLARQRILRQEFRAHRSRRRPSCSRRGSSEHHVRGWLELAQSAVTSNPFMSGSWTSSTTRSGCSVFASCTASRRSRPRRSRRSPRSRAGPRAAAEARVVVDDQDCRLHGISARTRVSRDRPRWTRTSRPSSASTRSARPRRPEPRVMSTPPEPRRPRPRRPRTRSDARLGRAQAGPAYLATFVSDSRRRSTRRPRPAAAGAPRHVIEHDGNRSAVGQAHRGPLRAPDP